MSWIEKTEEEDFKVARFDSFKVARNRGGNVFETLKL
jgi:hypothetical protein